MVVPVLKIYKRRIKQFHTHKHDTKSTAEHNIITKLRTRYGGLILAGHSTKHNALKWGENYLLPHKYDTFLWLEPQTDGTAWYVQLEQTFTVSRAATGVCFAMGK